MKSSTFAFSIKLPKIVFGENAIERIGEEAEKIGGKRILVVTDEILQKIGLIKKVQKPLQDKNFEVTIVKTEPEPTIETAEKIAQIVRNSSFDIIVGVGGGSCLDMAKVASIAANNPGDIKQYIGINKIKRAGLPKILVPTTAGTGSEVTPNAIIITSDDLMKSGIVSEYNIADVSIVDPRLTESMPPRLTATTGLDALSHAIESYMSIKSNPLTDALALEATRLILANLYTAFTNGKNIEARSNMSMAALLAGITISMSGTCAGHAAAYAFAAKYKIPHGLSCAVSLPYIIKYNASVCPSKIIELSHVIDKDATALTLEEATKKVIERIVDLMEKLCIPYKLKDLNIPADDIPNLAKRMIGNTRLLANNPKQVSEEDAIEIFKNMWEGRLT
mgnify:CR=1 FL=1